MKLRRIQLGLPLLAKELTELAERRRTYVLRALYAIVFFAFVWVELYSWYDWHDVGPRAGITMLGRGHELMTFLVMFQFVGIFAFMPAMTAGVITSEKERGTLTLLFLTRLGPWTIVFEKLLGRLLPMVAFLLLSLPLMAIAYSLGGVSSDYLIGSVWMLLVTALQVGAIAVCCSAMFRSTVIALLATYVFGFILYFGLAILHELFGVNMSKENGLAFFGPAQLEFTNWGTAELELLTSSWPIVASTALFLVLARAFLTQRAFVEPRNVFLVVFRWIDQLFSRWNEKYLGGVVLVRETNRLPTTAPVAWRETQKKSLGTFRYLVRVFLVIELPVVGFCLIALMMSDGRSYNAEPFSAIATVLWILATFVVVASATGTVASERSRETLDVLLATPMSGRQIVTQKAQGVKRLIIVLFVPFFTIFLTHMFISNVWQIRPGAWNRSGQPVSHIGFLICSSLALLVFLPLVGWISIWASSWARSQIRAMAITLTIITVWCCVPIILGEFVYDLWRFDTNWFLPFSPVAIILASDSVFVRELTNWNFRLPYTFFFIAVYCVVLVQIRRLCLSRADRNLGRPATLYAYEPIVGVLEHAEEAELVENA